VYGCRLCSETFPSARSRGQHMRVHKVHGDDGPTAIRRICDLWEAKQLTEGEAKALILTRVRSSSRRRRRRRVYAKGT